MEDGNCVHGRNTMSNMHSTELDAIQTLRAYIDATADNPGSSEHRQSCRGALDTLLDCINRQSATTDRVVRRERDAMQREVETLRRMVRSVKVFEGEVSEFEWWVTRGTVRRLPCWQAVILRKGNEARSKRVQFVDEYGSAHKAIEAVYLWFSTRGLAETFQCRGLAETIEALRSLKVFGRWELGGLLLSYVRAMLREEARSQLVVPAIFDDDSFQWSTRGAQIYVDRTCIALDANAAALVNAANILLWDKAFEADVDWQTAE
jgi:hypothetical protein